MKVQITTSNHWYRIGQEYEARIPNTIEMKRYGNGVFNRAGDYWITTLRGQSPAFRFIRRDDCQVIGVMEIGKDKKYQGPHARMQQSFMEYLKFKHRNLLAVHIPNEGKRSVHGGKQLKLEGMVKGMPDVLIFEQSPPYVGMAIELKTDGDSVKQEQWDCLQALYQRGWWAGVCWNLDAATNLVDIYKNNSSQLLHHS